MHKYNMSSFPAISQFHTLVFDFDGIFTDNKVVVNQNGIESVCCDRSDGLGFNMLRSYLSNSHSIPDILIVSRESNQIAQKRAQKLQIPCYLNIKNKLEFLKVYLQRAEDSNMNGVLYAGNDLNDYAVMRVVGYSVAPQDAHPLILKIASKVLPKNGGDGFVRLLIEKLIGIDGYSEEKLIELIHNC
jgi:3-deoxy-D-manno-octulosonate 8-phosphate phosphatase (KDO 8-P phosphatase)